MKFGIKLKDVLIGLLVSLLGCMVFAWLLALVLSSGSRQATANMQGTIEGTPAAEVGVSLFYGCWEVEFPTTPEGEALGLSASWIDDCGQADRASVVLGELSWPERVLTLPAWAPESPNLKHAVTHAKMLESSTRTPGTAGALLFLPVTADGRGYFVAGWATDDDSGIVVGRYGNPPANIGTPGGRVYFEQTQLVRRGHVKDGRTNLAYLRKKRAAQLALAQENKASLQLSASLSEASTGDSGPTPVMYENKALENKSLAEMSL